MVILQSIVVVCVLQASLVRKEIQGQVEWKVRQVLQVKEADTEDLDILVLLVLMALAAHREHRVLPALLDPPVHAETEESRVRMGYQERWDHEVTEARQEIPAKKETPEGLELPDYQGRSASAAHVDVVVRADQGAVLDHVVRVVQWVTRAHQVTLVPQETVAALVNQVRLVALARTVGLVLKDHLDRKGKWA